MPNLTTHFSSLKSTPLRWKVGALLVACAGCTPMAELRLGKPIGYHAAFAETAKLCVVEALNNTGQDVIAKGEPLRADEPIELAAGRYHIQVQECDGRMGLVGSIFSLELRATAKHRYEILISSYSVSMGGPEGPSYVDEVALRDATIGRTLRVVRGSEPRRNRRNEVW